MASALLAELGHELWIGDAGQIRASAVRLQKIDEFRRGSAVARVAVARKLAVRMFWMLRSGADYAQLVRMQGSPAATLVKATTPLG